MKAAVDFLAKARAAYRGKPPDWIVALAVEANRTGLRTAAKRIGYSAGLASHVIANSYPAATDKVAAKVRGALMNETVACPVLGEIGRDHCITQQGMPRTGASSVRARLYRACRGGCPHSMLDKEGRNGR